MVALLPTGFLYNLSGHAHKLSNVRLEIASFLVD